MSKFSSYVYLFSFLLLPMSALSALEPEELAVLGAKINSPLESTYKSKYALRVFPEKFEHDELKIVSPSGAVLLLQFEDRKINGTLGVSTKIYRVLQGGQETGSAVISLKMNTESLVISGYIKGENEHLEIKGSDGEVTLTERDFDADFSCGNHENYWAKDVSKHIQDAQELDHESEEATSIGEAESGDGIAFSEAPVHYTILLGHVNRINNEEAISFAASLEASLNATYVRSGLSHITAEVIHVEAIQESSYQVQGTLTALRTDGGEYERLRDLRDELQADVLYLINDAGSGSCGVAYLNWTPQRNYILGVSRYNCGVDTAIHEFGHMFGAQHAERNTSNPPNNHPYAYGLNHLVNYRWLYGIMSYSARRRYVYSNPLVTFDHDRDPDTPEQIAGFPEGSERPADNARMIRQTAPLIAAMGEQGSRPEAPYVLNVLTQGDILDRIGLYFFSVDDFTEYELFRSETAGDPCSGDPIAALSGTSTTLSFEDTAAELEPGIRYYYSARVANPTGECSYERAGYLGMPKVTGLELTALTESEGTLTFDPQDSAGGYNIYRSGDCSGAPTTVSSNSVTLSGLTQGDELTVKALSSFDSETPASPCSEATLFDTSTEPFQCAEADLNGNGAVEILDLLIFLPYWFELDLVADTNGNGSVEVQDLLSYMDLFHSC